ncbi:MAG: hypothetical protein ACRDBL_11220 [Rhabdaerophilum sp.]
MPVKEAALEKRPLVGLQQLAALVKRDPARKIGYDEKAPRA